MCDDDNTPIAILYPQILCVPRYTQHYLVDILGESLPAYSNEEHPPPYTNENILDLENICLYYILLDIVLLLLIITTSGIMSYIVDNNISPSTLVPLAFCLVSMMGRFWFKNVYFLLKVEK